MAQNTFKKQKKKKSKKSVKLNFNIFSDRKFQIAVGLTLLLCSFFLLVAFISYLFTGKVDQSVVEATMHTSVKESGKEVANWFGLFGAVTAHYFIFSWFGVVALLIPPFLFNLSVKILYHKQLFSVSRSFVFTVFYLIWTSLILGYFVLHSEEITEWAFLSGGVGYELAILTESLMGWGAVLFALFLFAVFNMYFFNITRIESLRAVGDWINSLPSRFKLDKSGVGDDIRSVIERVKQEVEEEDSETTEESMDDETATWTVTQVPGKKTTKRERETPSFEVEDNIVEEDTDLSDEEPIDPFAAKEKVPRPKESQKIELDTSFEPRRERIEKEDLEMEVQEPKFQEKQSTELENYDPTLDLPRYRYPTPDLLIDYPKKDVRVSKEELEQNKDKIVETLVNFKIGISSIKATIGPTVTLYEIVPEAGVKISKIKNLEDDIALSLAALGIRIIAPIPGRGTIGIEVPNKNREMVDIKSVITTEKFMKSDKELPIVLGKTISNEVFVSDLAKMPHLLMAGATGQGKSVGLNTILTSLIYKKHPSQLKLVLVDPKKVELTLFNKLERHFLAMLPDSEEPIITDTQKVVYTLNSLCIEMDTRYNLLKDAACRNIKEYNQKFINRKLNPNKGHRYLPYIVLVIDELADLMMTAGKEVETPIARLAQLARAIGIHLIVATQRPSVNVITGIIKANFPARISFKVTSKVDSRTILDAGGADQLIGMGDMLLSMGSDMIRLQCAFVDTPEIDEICEYVGDQRGYDSAYMLPEFQGEEEGEIGSVDLSDRDVLFEDAAKLIVIHQQGSTSLIQRKMKLGYNRAGRLIDQLEAAGIVGPFEGSKAREVLIKDEYSLEQLLSEIDNKY